MDRLYKALVENSKSDMYPYHMPGHKRRLEEGFLSEVLKYDITEIDDFDDLHAAEGIILEAEKRAAAYYGASETHYLINGSSSGVISAIYASTSVNGKIIMARNCHKSAYYAAEIKQLRTVYYYPDCIKGSNIYKSVSVKDLEKLVDDNPDTEAVIITSPTYDGIVSDVKSIADMLHNKGIVLIVDEAHGAHFGISGDFPVSAVKSGADIVIQSLHKMLPSPTQTALIHINGELADREKIRHALKMFQSSSPSYLFMGAMEHCIDYIVDNGKRLSSDYIKRYEDFVLKAEKLKVLKCLSKKSLIGYEDVFDQDSCKIIISTENAGISGKELYDELRIKYHLQPEMAAGKYVLLLLSVMDGEEAFSRLWDAVKRIDESLLANQDMTNSDDKAAVNDFQIDANKIIYPKCEAVMTLSQAAEKASNYIKLENSEGYTGSDYVMIYPPGIPIIVPGEKINKSCIENIERALSQGLKVTGLGENKEVSVIWEKSTT